MQHEIRRAAGCVLVALLMASALASTSASKTDWDRQYSELQEQIASRGLGKAASAESSPLLNANAGVLATDRDPLDVVLRRTQALIDRLGSMGARSCASFQARLDDIKRRAGPSGLGKTAAAATTARTDLYYEASALRKEAAFSNPLLNFNQLLFVERGIVANGLHDEYNGEHSCDEYFGHNGKPGGGLYILKDPFGASPQRINVLQNSTVQKGLMAGASLNGGSFEGPDLSFDGTRIAFAWSPGGVNENNPPTSIKWTRPYRFRIFVVNVDGTNLTELNGDVNEDDFDPCWLPGDNRIVFLSTRRGGYGRCHPRPVPSYTLCSMKNDGSDLYPIDWHETNEFQPSIDNDGMIVYTRWDYVDRGATISHHFWKCYPDGRDPRSPHGNYPHPFSTIAGFVDPAGRGKLAISEFNYRAIPGTSGQYVANTGPHHGQAFGEIMLLDVTKPDDGEVSQVKMITSGNPVNDETGSYGTPWPLSDAFFICNYQNGIYLVDAMGNRELIYQCTINPGSNLAALFRPIDPMPVRARKLANGSNFPVLATQTYQGERATLPDHNPAKLLVNNVYTADIPLPAGVKIKWMRIVELIPKAVSWFYDAPKINYGYQSLVRMPLGIVPVEDDGSVYCEAPVNKCIYFQLLDENGIAVHSMRSATYVHPGEQLSCVGCHENKWQAVPPQNISASRRPPSIIAPEVIDGTIPFNWYRLVKPVLDSKCASCHKSQQKGPDMSYASLKSYTFWFEGGAGGEGSPGNGGSRTTPGKFGSGFATLTKYLDPAHYNVQLTAEERRRVTLWLDLNSNELGAYTNVEAQQRGEIVWPELDVDPANPIGTENPKSNLSPVSLRLTPSIAVVKPSAQQLFIAQALDSLRRPVIAQPQMQWRVDGGGSINASGLFTAGAVEGGPYTVTVTANVQSGILTATATLLVSSRTDCELLPAGYIKKMLVLANGSDYVIPTIADPWTGSTPPATVIQGATTTINGVLYKWTGMESSTGMWADGNADNFVAYFSITLACAQSRDVSIVYRNDDDLKIWQNGTVVVNAIGWDGGVEKTSSLIKLAVGNNTFVARLTEGGGGNHFAMKFVDASGVEVNNLCSLPIQIGNVTRIPSRDAPVSRPTVFISRATLMVHVGDAEETRVELFDLQGVCVGTWRLSGNSMYALPLPRACGSYLVRLRHAQHAVTEKLVITLQKRR
jgi:hypothetical protein